jgi:hypothetical protein
MSTAVETALLVVGAFALAWALFSPHANILLRLLAGILGISALIIASILGREHHGGRQ